MGEGGLICKAIVGDMQSDNSPLSIMASVLRSRGLGGRARKCVEGGQDGVALYIRRPGHAISQSGQQFLLR